MSSTPPYFDPQIPHISTPPPPPPPPPAPPSWPASQPQLSSSIPPSPMVPVAFPYSPMATSHIPPSALFSQMQQLPSAAGVFSPPVGPLSEPMPMPPLASSDSTGHPTAPRYFIAATPNRFSPQQPPVLSVGSPSSAPHVPVHQLTPLTYNSVVDPSVKPTDTSHSEQQIVTDQYRIGHDPLSPIDASSAENIPIPPTAETPSTPCTVLSPHQQIHYVAASGPNPMSICTSPEVSTTSQYPSCMSPNVITSPMPPMSPINHPYLPPVLMSSADLSVAAGATLGAVPGTPTSPTSFYSATAGVSPDTSGAVITSPLGAIAIPQPPHPSSNHSIPPGVPQPYHMNLSATTPPARSHPNSYVYSHHMPGVGGTLVCSPVMSVTSPLCCPGNPMLPMDNSFQFTVPQDQSQAVPFQTLPSGSLPFSPTSSAEGLHLQGLHHHGLHHPLGVSPSHMTSHDFYAQTTGANSGMHQFIQQHSDLTPLGPSAASSGIHLHGIGSPFFGPPMPPPTGFASNVINGCFIHEPSTSGLSSPMASSLPLTLQAAAAGATNFTHMGADTFMGHPPPPPIGTGFGPSHAQVTDDFAAVVGAAASSLTARGVAPCEAFQALVESCSSSSSSSSTVQHPSPIMDSSDVRFTSASSKPQLAAHLMGLSDGRFSARSSYDFSGSPNEHGVVGGVRDRGRGSGAGRSAGLHSRQRRSSSAALNSAAPPFDPLGMAPWGPQVYMQHSMAELRRGNATPLLVAMLAHPDEFKNPSCFLKIYGDPACGSKETRPMPKRGKDGNWECPKCHNVNYPRRFRCNKDGCSAERDKEGDKIVSDYARSVYNSYKKQGIGKNNYNLLALNASNGSNGSTGLQHVQLGPQPFLPFPSLRPRPYSSPKLPPFLNSSHPPPQHLPLNAPSVSGGRPPHYPMNVSSFPLPLPHQKQLNNSGRPPSLSNRAPFLMPHLTSTSPPAPCGPLPFLLNQKGMKNSYGSSKRRDNNSGDSKASNQFAAALADTLLSTAGVSASLDTDTSGQPLGPSGGSADAKTTLADPSTAAVALPDPSTAAVPLADAAADPSTAAVPLAVAAADPSTAAVALADAAADPSTAAVALADAAADPSTAAVALADPSTAAVALADPSTAAVALADAAADAAADARIIKAAMDEFSSVDDSLASTATEEKELPSEKEELRAKHETSEAQDETAIVGG